MGRNVLLTTFAAFIAVCAATNIARVGNNLLPSSSGVDVPGVSFINNDVIEQEGVLFAFSAFFRSDKPVRFQVWRPVDPNNSTANNFMLLSETRVIPSVTRRKEDIYLASKFVSCVRVRPGDRLGVFMDEAPGAVAYVFDGSNPMALGHTVANISDPVRINGTVKFDSLLFPYVFSITAHLHTDLSGYGAFPADGVSVKCPKLLIPEYNVATLPPPTGRPGATGPRGFMGGVGPMGATGRQGPQGSMGAPGPGGPLGNMGATGPSGAQGAQGIPGKLGATGSKGPQGVKGDQGRPGPAGPVRWAVNGTKSAASSGSGGVGIMNLAFMAWLAVVTIVVFIIILLLIVYYRKQEAVLTKVDLPSAMPGTDYKPSWMDVMGEETGMEAMCEESEVSYTGGSLTFDGTAYKEAPAMTSSVEDVRSQSGNSENNSSTTLIIPDHIPEYGFGHPEKCQENNRY